MRRVKRLAPIVVLVVFAVVFRHEVAHAAARLLDLRPVIFLVFPLFWLWNHVAGYGWRSLIAAAAPEQAPPTAFQLSLLRLQSQAVNLAMPALGGLGGGAVRIGMTRRIGLAPAAAAALLDDVAGGVAGLVFAAFGLALVSGQLLGIDHRAIAAIAAAVAAVVWLGTVYGAPALAVLFRRDKPLGQALRMLADSRHRIAPAFAASVFWHLVERVLAVGEIYLAFLALGLHAGLAAAFFVHAVSVAVALLLFFLPGQPGAAEAGIAAACASVGLDPLTGLTVAFIRRARQLVVAGAGLTLLAVSGWRPAIKAAPSAERSQS